MSAKTVLLVAPAGYGKTTFAAQWLSCVGGVRWTATHASSDLAILARDLSSALSNIVPIDPTRIDAALRVAASSPERVQLLARTLLNQIEAPVDPWLVIDDYQLLMPNRPAEAFVNLIENCGYLKLMIASRERPSWATSRRFVHLELVEIGTPDLAFDDEEVSELLLPTLRNARLRAQARGWPAVIALAAHVESHNITITEDTLAESLYDYFAEELFERATPDAQTLLIQIALLPRARGDGLLDNAHVDDLLREVYETGLVQYVDEKLDVHPLARSFLLTKARERSDVRELVDASVTAAILATMWDQAFELVRDFSHLERLEELLKAALAPLIETGRIAMVQNLHDMAR